MAIQKQAVNLNFAQGLDQKMDPRQVKPGKFLSMVNRVFNKGGLLEKTNGYAALGTSCLAPPYTLTSSQIPVNLTSGRMVTGFQDELVLLDGFNVFSYADTASNWAYRGRKEICATSSQAVYKDQYNNIMPDSAYNATLGFYLYAWESWTADPNMGGTLRWIEYSVIDATTGLSCQSGVIPANSGVPVTAYSPRCVSISNKLYLFFYNPSSGKVQAKQVTENSIGATVDIVTNIDGTNPNYDVLVNNSLIYVAYNGTGSTVKVASFDSSLNSVASVSKGETATNGICAFADSSNNVWVGYNNGSASKYFIMNSALSVTVLAPTSLDGTATASGVKNITGVMTSATGAIFFYDKPGNPVLGPAVGTTPITVSTNPFVQPAVGSTISITVSAAFTSNGTIIYIPTGGYYFALQSGSSTTITIRNLGFSGNAAPGANVSPTPEIIYTTNGYINALITYNTGSASGSVGTPTNYIRSAALASKAYLNNGVAHVNVVYDSPIQPTYFATALFNVSTGATTASVVAKISEAESGGVPYRSLLSSVNTVSSGVFQCALNNRTFDILLTSNDNPIQFFFLGVFSSKIDFTFDDIQSNDLGNNLQIGGGVTSIYDGGSVSEQGFNLYPENITATNGGTGGLSDGLYGYQVVYAWVDHQGQTHRSAPSPVLSIDCSASSENTIVVPTLRITDKTSVTIELYRTEANGSIYYRIDPRFTTYPINNSVTSDTVTIVEGVPDDDISGNQQLYTAQEVENIAVPGSNIMTEYKNRLIAIPSENPFVWLYSKQVVINSPVEFSDLFQQNMGTVGGPLRGASRLDDKLILFKAQSIFYVTGTGPGPNGANNDFSDPQFITADAGLEDTRSIVTTPVGLMFKSSKGIYLLDRSLQTRYIGAAVEDYNQYTVRGAKLIPSQNQVKFILSNGTALLYDYYWTDENGIGQWGVRSNLAAASDTLFQDLHTYVTSAGQVYQETPGLYLDGASAINTSWKTGWFNLAGLQGFERAYFFYFLAQYISAHTLTINLYYDYDATTVQQTLTITPDSSELEQWRVFLSKQKCQAFQIELIEACNGSGAGYSMSGLDLVVGLKKGYTTIKATSSAS